MKQLVRYFSLGLITAGIFMLIGLYFSDRNNADELSVEEMIPLVEDKGFHVLDNNDYISMTIKNDGNKEQVAEKDKSDEKSEETNSDDSTKDKKEESEKADDEEVSEEKEELEKKEETESKKSYKLNVESGMPTSAISDVLEENNIIEDSFEFNQYLIENDFHLKVQIGEVEVSSDMSFYELAEALTN